MNQPEQEKKIVFIGTIGLEPVEPKREKKDLEYIPYKEGMKLYQKIKEKHNDLFRDLADL